MPDPTTATNVSASRIELSDFLENEPPEVLEAKQLAKRYRLPYIDLLPTEAESPIDYEELAKIPVEMMLRKKMATRGGYYDALVTSGWAATGNCSICGGVGAEISSLLATCGTFWTGDDSIPVG